MAAALSILASTTHARAPQSEDDQQGIALSGEVSLADLVEFVAAESAVVIEYEPRILPQSLNLQVPDRIGAPELTSLLHAALARNGLAAFEPRSGSGLQVAPVDQARTLARIREEIDVVHPVASYARLLNSVPSGVSASVLSRDLTEVLGAGGHVATLGEGRQIIISGHRDSIRQASALIDAKALAAQERRPEIVRVTPHFVDVSELATRLAAVIAGQQGSAAAIEGRILVAQGDSAITVMAPNEALSDWIALIQLYDQPSPAVRRVYSAGSGDPSQIAAVVDASVDNEASLGSRGDWSVTPNQALGTIAVTGTVHEHDQVASILAQIDARPAAETLSVERIPVLNRDAAALRELILSLRTQAPGMQLGTGAPIGRAGAIRDAASTAGLDDPLPPRAEPSGQTVPQPLPGQMMGIEIDEPTNSLVVRATPREIREIRSLVTQLDIRQPQVSPPLSA